MLKRLWFSGSTWATAEAMCFLHSVGHSGDHPMVLEDMKKQRLQCTDNISIIRFIYTNIE